MQDTLELDFTHRETVTCFNNLFAPAAAPVPPAVIIPQQNTKVIPEDIQGYESYWTEFYTAFTSYSKQLETLNSHSKTALVTVDDEPLAYLHKKLVLYICTKAELEFAAEGSSIVIDNEKVQELPVCELHAFNPIKLWNYLDKTYNNDQGKHQSYALAAKKLAYAQEIGRSLYTNENQEIKVISGRCVLSVRFYGEWDYNYSAKERLLDFLKALKCVAVWCNLWNPDDSEAIEAIENNITKTRGDARHMGKMEYWPEVAVHSFKEKLEFRLKPELAEQIQVFLATYGEKND